jgi:hypothetical protein
MYWSQMSPVEPPVGLVAGVDTYLLPVALLPQTTPETRIAVELIRAFEVELPTKILDGFTSTATVLLLVNRALKSSAMLAVVLPMNSLLVEIDTLEPTFTVVVNIGAVTFA